MLCDFGGRTYRVYIINSCGLQQPHQRVGDRVELRGTTPFRSKAALRHVYREVWKCPEIGLYHGILHWPNYSKLKWEKEEKR